MNNLKTIILAILLTIVMVAQIVLAFVLYARDGNPIIRNIGWGILWLSAIFGWLPIFTFKKWGGVTKGKSYIRTTKLVDKGVYAIVRHPQYVAGMLMGTALPLIAQRWILGVLGVMVIVINYIDTFEEEASCRKKFGNDYTRYMQSVPRVNLILGIIRALKQRNKN